MRTRGDVSNIASQQDENAMNIIISDDFNIFLIFEFLVVCFGHSFGTQISEKIKCIRLGEYQQQTAASQQDENVVMNIMSDD